jgi:SAM-dependent methyltransferase
MTEVANQAQADFWNADPGLNWVRFQPDMDLLLGGVAEVLLAQAAPRPGEQAVDIGCGAGATTLAVARAVGPSGSVLGVDISEPLLRRAEERRQAAGLSQANFLLADAQDHPLGPAESDLLLSRFGVMFFADPAAAFRNMAAALRPGGRMVLAVWSSAQANPFFSTPGRIAAERLGRPAPSDPDGPGPMALHDPQRVSGLLRLAGLDDIRIEPVPVDLHHPAGLEAVVTMLGHLGGIPGLMREKGGTAEDMAAILSDVRSAFAGYVTADGIRIPAVINLCSAVRR